MSDLMSLVQRMEAFAMGHAERITSHRHLLASLPSADELMPELSLDELEQAVPLPTPQPY